MASMPPSCLHFRSDRPNEFPSLSSETRQLSRPQSALTPNPSFSLAHQHTIPRHHPSPLTSHPVIISTAPAAATTPPSTPPADRPASIASSHQTVQSSSTYFTSAQAPATPPRTPTKRVTFPLTPAAPKRNRTRSPVKKLGAGLPSLNFGDLFTLQGSSAPIELGVLPSPSKEPSSFTPQGSERSSSVKGLDRMGAVGKEEQLRRPKHTRSGSTLQAAANFLGLGGSVSPTKRQETIFTTKRERGRTLQKLSGARVDAHADEQVEDDRWLNLNIDKALFSDDAPLPTGFRDEAYETLASNAHKVLTDLQAAYISLYDAEASAQDELDDVLDERETLQEDLDESRERISCLKEQLGGMGQQLADEVETNAVLREELKEERKLVRRMQTVRLVGADGDGHRGRSRDFEDELVLMMESEGEGQTVERVFSASGEDGEESGLEGPAAAARPGSASSAVSSNPSTRPSTPRSAVSTAPSSAPDRNSSPVRSGDEVKRASAAFWRDAAPFLKPEAGEDKLKKENEELKMRIRELECTIEGCLGLVD